MAGNGRPEARIILFDAAHLNITIDPSNPPPPASDTLIAARQQAKTAWEAFEAAENALSRTDDEVQEAIDEYASSIYPQRPAGAGWQAAKARATSRIHPPLIQQIEVCCQELDTAVQALKDAALKEPETVEARATMEVDLEVIQKGLETTREMIRTAHFQLDKVRQVLGLS